MLFSSILFIFYFLPAVLLLYFACRFSTRLQNVVLLFASLIFYAWGEPRFVIIMISSILFNYVCGLLINATLKNKTWSKIALIFTIVGNIGNLFVFKYLDFVIKNINYGAHAHIPLPDIVLPLGISFFTFHSLSYIIDVYRGTVKVQKNLIYLALYIAIFPALIAGPIVRYNTIANQLLERTETWRKFSIGCCRFVTGLGKKVLIANNMAIVADRIFAMSADSSIPLLLAWLGAIAYTFQIFFDFSAYSDMAIGLGLMFGYEFEENFNYPYLSKSISEFWRRWHISLGTWFRDYVYFPLGGSRVGSTDRLVWNLFIVWMLTGIWHGAEWTFVVWGFINFVCITSEKLFQFEQIQNINFIKHVYALFVIVIGWVIFRANNLQAAGKYIGSMFGSGGFWSDTAFMFVKEFAVFFIIALILCAPVARRVNRIVVDNDYPALSIAVTILYPVVILSLFVLSVTYLVKGSYNPFIYFQF
ncbi:MBOAT family O-acyltransferase [Sporolactobacillus laevolacticus]|uniref:Alginate O-acetylation protein n=1 Tax=Sporolactobacillus laevolacticus DSM 442 TaxID=1395513 RepID=V6IZ07_9BACL|nr:MBOAT family protein [Sporolactobacillus laevolacticus]EST12697.1 alginate O-acetylation protein [Sporolactobacillus laevolacticus DSM 442]